MTQKRSEYILTPEAVRERSQKLFDLNQKGQGHFNYHPEKWDQVTEFVHQTILEKYPTLEIPFHSRLGHFRAGGVDRLAWRELGMQGLSSDEKLQRLIDLIIPSVLLDAGAGDNWSYQEGKTGQKITRSEGLGVASYHMFLQGLFSSKGKLESDAIGLQEMTGSILEKAFQVQDHNALVGVSGRVGLLKTLGKTMANNPRIFFSGRPSDLLGTFRRGDRVDALQVLTAILKYLGPIWPSRLSLDGVALGDTWSHPALGPAESFESLVPFHKLSQWLSYSILDACLYCGFKVDNVNRLTGLPEYRNGGLFIDLGLFTAKDPKFLTLGITPEMPFTIEWRAMTVICLDLLAEKIQKKLGKTPEQFPLAKVLEGGSWWAGRKVAGQKRPGGTSPINVVSDGTVF